MAFALYNVTGSTHLGSAVGVQPYGTPVITEEHLALQGYEFKMKGGQCFVRISWDNRVTSDDHQMGPAVHQTVTIVDRDGVLTSTDVRCVRYDVLRQMVRLEGMMACVVLSQIGMRKALPLDVIMRLKTYMGTYAIKQPKTSVVAR